VGARARHGGHVLDTRHPWRHFPEQVAVSNVGKVGAGLGRLGAEFGHGLKTKFALLLMLYIFHLRLRVIRVVD
jgi:hypothetical protein